MADWEYSTDGLYLVGPPQKYAYIASFDPGRRWFGYCVQRVDLEVVSDINGIPAKRRYNPDGTPTTEFQQILDAVYSTGKIVEIGCEDMLGELETTMENIAPALRNISDFLDSKAEIFGKCSCFLIERQFRRVFGRGANRVQSQNTAAIRVQHHIDTYLQLSYPEAVIVEFAAHYKTQILGCPKDRNTDSKRKPWAVDILKDILIHNDDLETLSHVLNFRGKKSDMADTVLMVEAFKILAFIDMKNF